MSAPDAWVQADPIGCPRCGREGCEDHLPPDDSSQTISVRTRLIAVPALEVMATPAPAEIVEGVAWAGCLSVVVSESGAGKTFVLLGLAAAISDDVSWHGRTVHHGSVVYVSFEGDAFGLRLRALRDVVGHRLNHLYVVRATDPLSPTVTRDGEQRSIGEITLSAELERLVLDLAATGRPPIVLIINDTVRASLTGSEDSSEHAAAFLRAFRRILACLPGAAGILAHHAGWQDGDTQRKRERGSSAWRGNCDATLYLEAGEYDPASGEVALTLRTLKVRDAERPAPLHLRRRRVELLESDRRGDPVTTCIVELDRRSREDRDAEQQQVADVVNRQADLVVLRTIAERPEVATSQDRIRLLVGTRKTAVAESLTRLAQRGWIIPNRRNQPYTVTDTGRAALESTS